MASFAPSSIRSVSRVKQEWIRNAMIRMLTSRKTTRARRMIDVR